MPHSVPESCTPFYIFILILARTLDLNFCYYSTVYTSVDVCWNIRHAKLKFYSFPEMRLYFLVSLVSITAETGNEFRLRLPPVHHFERDWNSKQYGGNGG